MPIRLESSKKRRIQMLKLEQIKKSYDGVEILKDINLEIEDGEIVSILGPSGLTEKILQNFRWKKEDSILYFRTMHCFRI